MNTQTNKTAKAGAVLIVTSGAFDNFGLDGLVRVLVDFDPLQAIVDFKAKASASAESGTHFHAFIEHLEKSGLVVSVPHQVLYLGDYYGLDASSARFD